MKRLYFIILFVVTFIVLTGLSVVNAKVVNGYDGITKTGHADIMELDFYDQSNKHLLLNQMSETTKNNALKKVKRKAFGWNTYLINREIPIWYISNVVFSKVNKTSNPLTYSYNLTYNSTGTTEVSYTGTIAAKLSGKFDEITLNLDDTLKIEYSTSLETFYEEETSFKVVVPIGKKVSLLVKGDADLYTGVGKFYLFGITFNKGTFEYIDKTTEYYELYEEDA